MTASELNNKLSSGIEDYKKGLLEEHSFRDVIEDIKLIASKNGINYNLDIKNIINITNNEIIELENDDEQWSWVHDYKNTIKKF